MAEALSEQGAKEYRTLRLPYPRLAESSFIAAKTEIPVITDEALFEACGTRIAFTTRKGGVSQGAYGELNLFYGIGDNPSAVQENRRLLCDALGAGQDADSLIVPKQVHGTVCVEVGDIEETKQLVQEGADGVICTSPDVPVLLCSGDCIVMILVAPTGGFAVVHAGWRGALASIAEIGLGQLVKATGCLASDINCYIGPHIDACCYEVDSELLKSFVSQFGSECDAGNNHLDLAAAVTCSLMRAGADKKRIAKTGFCTSCHNDSFYSYRAQDGTCGRHGAFAFWRE